MATEGASYKDPAFNTNYVNAYNAGVIRGAYHFARPGRDVVIYTTASWLNTCTGSWTGMATKSPL